MFGPQKNIISSFNIVVNKFFPYSQTGRSGVFINSIRCPNLTVKVVINNSIIILK